MGLVFEYDSYSHVGMRDNNEDCFLCKPMSGGILALVADGLGGHDNGEVASRLAVETVAAALEDADFDEDELGYAIVKASQAIVDANIFGHTTVAALWIHGNEAIAAHVGDSRIYHFRNNKIQFQSLDHSAVQMSVLVGELPKDALRTHPDQNKLFRVLGDKTSPPKMDITELTVRPGDAFLLCSDGFWEPVTEELMEQTLSRAPSPAQWLAAMRQTVEAARDPRQDNNTAVCIFVK